VPPRRHAATAVDLAERAVAQDGPERGTALLENSLPVSHEQHREITARPLPQLPVVQCRHHGLAGPGGRHDEVAMAIVTLALDHQPLEHSLLVRIGMDIEPDERDARASVAVSVSAQRAIEPLPAGGWVVPLEMLGRPVGLKHRAHPFDHILRVDRREPHIPLEPVEQRGMREVGRADEGRAQSRVPLEQPSLRVQLGHASVERNANLRAEPD
jgi:hypothetical protein